VGDGERRSRERRLGAIMFTDVVGFTSISSRDESRALELLGEHRTLLQAIFPKYEGRVVKTMGDGFLVEFASAVEAVNCAVEAQNEVVGSNLKRTTDDRMMVRIGVHVGDIVHSEGDVLGDAVNVASRVQSLAEPGGICVTRQVFDQVKGKVQWQMVSLGLQELKNLPSPVEVFRIQLQPGSPESARRPELDPHRVAILPFANLSPDPNDRYFADGMTEELISTISKVSELSVISRTSAMRYKDTRLSLEQVGRELRTGTILEGSVRKAGERVRITAELLNVETDRYIWSQSYDRDLTDILGVQGEIAEKVAEWLRVKLLLKEKQSLGKKPTTSPEAYTLYLKGRFYWNERSEEGTNKAVRYFEEAARLDPRFAEAYSGLADAYAILADYGWMAPHRAAALGRENALKALAIDDGLAEAHASLGLITVNHFWDFGAGEREFKRAIELKPNYAPAYHWYGVMLHFMKRYEESFRMMERASELDPSSHVVKQGLAVALLGLGRTAEALQQFKRIAVENPEFVAVHYWTAVAHLALKEFPEALREGEKEVELDGGSDDAKLDLAWVKALAGEKEPAERLLNEIIPKTGKHISPVSVALVELGLGHEKKGFEWLEKACEEHDPFLLYFRSIPVFAEYWSDPRWSEIEHRAGLLS
jgi:class 3 adenylate cyclase/tetratricopeptide (TPR) repeat protein